MTSKAMVVYDDDCSICTGFANAMAPITSDVEWRGSRHAGDLPDGVSRELVEESILFIDDEGIHSHVEALQLIARQAGPLGSVAASGIDVLHAVPGGENITGWAYDTFSSNRHKVSALLVKIGVLDDACAVPGATHI
jgi:predicted DCC family thiol-disulfide oxidoreductase YuxK